MFRPVLISVLFFSSLKPAEAISCDSNNTQICYVRNQKISAAETFYVIRSSSFTDLILSSSCEMPSIPSTIFTSYPNITFLSASYNGLKVIGVKNFANAGKLKKLFLNQGDISRIPNGTFRTCANLENLQLCNHIISLIAVNAFQGLGNLNFLYLSNNSIETLHPAVFSMMPKLNILSLEMNKLKSLSPDIFKANSALLAAMFSSNQLVELPKDLFSFNLQLQSLNFDQNFLQSASTFGLCKANRF
jgi:Leucine-rich repeat (LRR) protein